jgi:hypothetical protein
MLESYLPLTKFELRRNNGKLCPSKLVVKSSWEAVFGIGGC